MTQPCGLHYGLKWGQIYLFDGTNLVLSNK